jgi:hypothetical protein
MFPLLCVQIKQKLFPNDDVSNSTVLTALKGAKRVSNLYPKELEQGCCMNTRDHHEYDTFNPDQIISVLSNRNADGLIDIIMSTREGKVIRRTEADDRNAWDDTSHSMEPGRLFPWEELPREATKGRVLEFVANIANKHNLSLVELTVFSMAVDHKSLTVQTSTFIVTTYYSHNNNDLNEPNQHCETCCTSLEVHPWEVTLFGGSNWNE